MQRSIKITSSIYEVLPLVKITSTSAGLDKRLIGVEDLLEANEYGIAFEVLCENLYEFSCPISQSAYKKIETIGMELEADDNLWLRLISLIIHLH